MGSNYKEEKKKIKERYNDQQIHNNDEDNVFENEEHHNNRPEEEDSNTRKFLQFEQENELDERSKNFRIRSYKSSKDKCKAVKSVVRRLLIIFLITTIICLTVFLISKFLAKKRLKTFILDGNNLDNIDSNRTTAELLKRGLDEIPIEELGTLHLINIQLTPSDLIARLKGGLHLKSLKLEAVKITGEFNDTVYLPELEEFLYDEMTEERSKGYQLSLPEKRLKSILFFRQVQKDDSPSSSSSPLPLDLASTDPAEEVDLTKIWNLNVNINITYEGYNVLFVDHINSKLVLPWLTYLKRDEIIQNAGKELRKLACNRLTLSIDSLPPKLTHLTLRDVKLLGGDFTDILRKLTKLVDIRVGFSEPTTLDISELPKRTLRNLALSKFSLFNSKGGSNVKSMRKFKLENLTLISTTFNSDVLHELPNLFQTTQFAISEYNIIGDVQSDEVDDDDEEDDDDDEARNEIKDTNELLLRKIVKTQAGRVFMYKYKGAVNSTLTSMKTWLGGVNVLMNDDNGDVPTNNFVLEKTSDSSLAWNFRNLGWSEWKLLKHNAFGHSVFWANVNL